MRKYLFTLLCCVIFYACKHEIENPNWTVDVIMPIAKTELKLTELLSDSILTIDTLTDESLLLVYMLESIEENLNKYISEEDLGFAHDSNMTIPSFSIPDIPITLDISLFNIIKGTILENTLTHGSNVPTPPFNIPSKTFPIDEIEYLDEIELESGEIKITIINNLPTDIDGLVCEVKNQAPDNTNISSTSFGIINQNDSVTRTIFLTNKIITNSLEINTDNLLFLGNTTPTIIDTSIGVTIKIEISNLIIKRLIGDIQDTIRLSESQESPSLYLEELVLKEVKVDSGSLQINLSTIIDVPVVFEFISSNITDINNNPLTLTYQITPNEQFNQSVNLSGWDINLTTLNDTSFLDYELKGYIPPGSVTLNLADTNTISYSISSFFKPKYVIADLHETTVEIENDTFNFDFFNDLGNGNNFSIETANITLGVENRIGVSCEFNLDVSSENSLDGNVATTTVNDALNAAEFDKISEIITPYYSEIEFNNIANIINIKPDLISVGGFVTLNSGTNNFIVYDEGLSITPNIEVPLSFIASNLILSDTAEIDLPSESEGILLKLIIDNGYPINTQINMHFLDEFNEILESKSHNIPSGKIGNDGKVYEATRSIIEIDIATENIEHIKKVNYIATFETQSQIEYNKIYSDYLITIQVIAEYQSIVGE